MATVAPQQMQDGDWKNQLQIPAKDLRYKTEVGQPFSRMPLSFLLRVG
jgi:hypothetical protein